MIIGLGTDIIELERMARACRKDFFKEKAFTQEERRQAGDRISFLAGNFAAKESLVKALGTGFRGIALSDVEVLRDERGKPYIRLYNKALQLYRQLECSAVHVSISNTRDYACASVILEK